MRADADEAVRRLAAQNIAAPAAPLLQGIARVLCGDLEGGDVSLQDAVSAGEEIGLHPIIADALCERSLVAMARNQWDRAEIMAGQASAALREAGVEDIYATPLACAAHARVAFHRGDVPAARQRSAPAVRDDLRAPLLCRSGTARARPRPPRAGRHIRGQDADTGGR